MTEISKSTVICEFDGVTSATIYTGFFSNLKKADNRLKWRVDAQMEAMTGFGKVLTLAEISKQLGKYGIITIFIESPLDGHIYQWGNYADKSWWEIGRITGYA